MVRSCVLRERKVIHNFVIISVVVRLLGAIVVGVNRETYIINSANELSRGGSFALFVMYGGLD